MQTLANWDGGPGPWILFFPLIWAAVVIGVVTVLRRTVGRGRRGPWRAMGDFGPPRDSRQTGDSPIALLGRRFATGEIDEDEYWRRLSVLDEQFGRPGKEERHDDRHHDASCRGCRRRRQGVRQRRHRRQGPGRGERRLPGRTLHRDHGPSGSGKSTLMHCAAGLDTLTSGVAFIGDTPLSTLDDRRLTLLRRDRVGFVFQAFNLIPTLTVAENITLPWTSPGRRAPASGSTRSSTSSACATGSTTAPPNSPADSSNASPWPGRSPAVPTSSSPTNPPATSTRSGEEVLNLLGRAVRRMDRTVVMVTHDPVAAAHADEVVFLADGRLVDRMESPTADKVLDRMKAFDAKGGRS